MFGQGMGETVDEYAGKTYGEHEMNVSKPIISVVQAIEKSNSETKSEKSFKQNQWFDLSADVWIVLPTIPALSDVEFWGADECCPLAISLNYCHGVVQTEAHR